MSAEENDGGSNGEPEATGNEGKSNANRTDETQENTIDRKVGLVRMNRGLGNEMVAVRIH